MQAVWRHGQPEEPVLNKKMLSKGNNYDYDYLQKIVISKI